MPVRVEVVIESTPTYERIAQKVAMLAAKGTSIETIARAEDVNWQTVQDALDFASTGRRPEPEPARKRKPKQSGPRKPVDVAEIVRLRDQENLSFNRIAERLGVCEGTVSRAYDRAHPEAVRDAAEREQTPKRGRYSKLGPEVYERIRAALRAGDSPCAIAAAVGCGMRTVYRVRAEMQAQDQARPGAS